MPEILDAAALDALLRALGDDRAFLAEIVTEYLEDAPRQLAAMRRAAMADDALELALASHTLKGTSLSVGAAALAEICREVEHRARAGGMAGCSALIAEAEVVFQATSNALRDAEQIHWGPA